MIVLLDDNYTTVLDALKDADVYVYKMVRTLSHFALNDTYITGLFVKEFRDQGIGHALIKHLQSEYDYLSLKVFEENHRAVHFIRI